MAGGFPALSGNELIKILVKEFGCEEGDKRTHGMALIRRTNDRVCVTVVPMKDDSLPSGTLSAILRQIGITKEQIKERL